MVLGDGTWPADLLADVAAITADDFVLTRDELDASLDLFVTARA